MRVRVFCLITNSESKIEAETKDHDFFDDIKSSQKSETFLHTYAARLHGGLPRDWHGSTDQTILNCLIADFSYSRAQVSVSINFKATNSLPSQ